MCHSAQATDNENSSFIVHHSSFYTRRLVNKSGFPHRYLVAVVMLLGLTGCVMERPASSAGDIEVLVPSDFVATQDNTAIQGNTAVIRLQPSTQQLEVGDTATVEIRVDNVTSLAEVDIELRFDPAILHVQDTDPIKAGIQIQPADFLATSSVVAKEAGNGTGVIRYILTQMVDIPPANGNGLLAVVTFTGFFPGSSDLTFSIVKLSANDAQLIPTTSESGQITVTRRGGDPTATPTEPVATPPPADTPVPVEPTPTTPPTVTPVPPVEPTADPAKAAEAPAATMGGPGGLPPGATLGFCYRVQLYETFYSLTHKFGVSAAALNQVNDLWPPDRVVAHQAVFIPTYLGHGPNFYIVEPGDTLAGIAERCRLPLSMVARVNGLAPDAVVNPGQVLEIPIPPFPPPSRYNYPTGPAPLIPGPVPRYP
jgi:LysM repeat protein